MAWPSTHICRKAWQWRKQSIDLRLNQKRQNINVIFVAIQAHTSHCQCHVQVELDFEQCVQTGKVECSTLVTAGCMSEAYLNVRLQ